MELGPGAGRIVVNAEGVSARITPRLTHADMQSSMINPFYLCGDSRWVGGGEVEEITCM